MLLTALHRTIVIAYLSLFQAKISWTSGHYSPHFGSFSVFRGVLAGAARMEGRKTANAGFQSWASLASQRASPPNPRNRPVLLPPACAMRVNSDGMCYPWMERRGAGNRKVAYSVAFPHPRVRMTNMATADVTLCAHHFVLSFAANWRVNYCSTSAARWKTIGRSGKFCIPVRFSAALRGIFRPRLGSDRLVRATMAYTGKWFFEVEVRVYL